MTLYAHNTHYCCLDVVVAGIYLKGADGSTLLMPERCIRDVPAPFLRANQYLIILTGTVKRMSSFSLYKIVKLL